VLDDLRVADQQVGLAVAILRIAAGLGDPRAIAALPLLLAERPSSKTPSDWQHDRRRIADLLADACRNDC
jgi:hypothetical protein